MTLAKPTREAPSELADVQLRIAALLRTPLSYESGSFVSERERYDAQLICSLEQGPVANADERLGVYHRQYWLRLFTVMQGIFPLAARLLGLFHFNALSQAYLCEHAPVHVELSRLGDGFCNWLATSPTARALLQPSAQRIPIDAMQQAASVDWAWHSAWTAPASKLWKPAADRAASLGRAKLLQAPTFALVSVDWSFVEMRRALAPDAGELPLKLPRRLPAARDWAIFRKERAIGQWPLDPDQAQLYRWCVEHSLDEAVGRLERSQSRKRGTALSQAVHRWFASGVEIGLWTGAEAP